MDYSNKKVLVCGMGKSGVASALLLKELGAFVTATDLKTREDLEDSAVLLEKQGVTLQLGQNPDGIIRDFDIIIVSPGLPTDLPFFSKAFDACIPVFGEIELAYSQCKNPIIAITGTNGKTTTTALTGEIMNLYRPGSVTVGNIGTPFCSKIQNLDPEAYVVAEISSFQLETAYTFRPVSAAILNITPDHLNRHGTLEKYADIKESIFSKQKPEDWAVLNYDDPLCREIGKRVNARVLYFSRETKVEQGVYVQDGKIYCRMGDGEKEVVALSQLQLPGGHNLENYMAAACLCLSVGVPVDVVWEGLVNFKGVEHRLEYIRTLDGVDYYNDSKATNTDAAIKALEAMDKPVLLIGGGRDKDLDFAPWVKLFEGKVKYFVTIGEAADKMIETCRAYGYHDYEKANSLKDALELCQARGEEGDCVLLSPACASFDMFDNYEQRGDVFREFVVALEKKK